MIVFVKKMIAESSVYNVNLVETYIVDINEEKQRASNESLMDTTRVDDVTLHKPAEIYLSSTN